MMKKVWQHFAIPPVSYTHLDVYKRQDYDIGDGYVDTLEVLAKYALKQCKKEVKEPYENLIKV